MFSVVLQTFSRKPFKWIESSKQSLFIFYAKTYFKMTNLLSYLQKLHGLRNQFPMKIIFLNEILHNYFHLTKTIQ